MPGDQAGEQELHCLLSPDRRQESLMGGEAMEMRCMSACVGDSRMHSLNGIDETGCGPRIAVVNATPENPTPIRYDAMNTECSSSPVYH